MSFLKIKLVLQILTPFDKQNLIKGELIKKISFFYEFHE